jgi:hypothetical protein
MIDSLNGQVLRWEFIVTLNYDWALIRGRRKRTVGVLVSFANVVPHGSPSDLLAQLYMLLRYMTLLQMLLMLRILNVFTPINCKVR